MTTPDLVTTASRVWTEHGAKAGARRPAPDQPQQQGPAGGRWRNAVLVFDTETTVDRTQQLTFGVYRVGTWREDGSLRILEEGLLFHADNLAERDPDGCATVQDYARTAVPEVEASLDACRVFVLRTRQEFVEHVLWPAIQADALIVGFNLPFDLSRLAIGASPARGGFQGGFSFQLWTRSDGKGGEHQFRPRIRIAHIDSKRARIGISQPKGRPLDIHGKPVVYRPGFLDLRTLVFALTDRGHSLDSACRAFGIENGKLDPGEHGHITADYIAYARQDVAITGELLARVRAEYDRHPIELEPCRAYSPASIAKAYYRAMGVTPRLQLQPDFPREVLGFTMSAYYGGRAECAIRRTPVPVVYTDVLSMYPTVNANMGLWRLHTAERLRVEECTAEAQALLDALTLDRVLDPGLWPQLTFFAQIVPDGNIVPVRADFGGTGSLTIAVTPFTSDAPHWYAGPDLAASALLARKVPTILRAFRLVPEGMQTSLQPVALGGTVPVDPRTGDFFRTVIEERKRVPRRVDLAPEERARLDKFLKVMANSGSYGVFVETNPEQLADKKTRDVTVFGGDLAPFAAATPHPETPGLYSFPPIASLITAGARLVLAIIERMVTNAGGAHSFCDTDSMAIVATRDGGLIRCPGGSERLPDGSAAIRALSWAQIDAIVARLSVLNPYDPEVVPGSILKIEEANFDPITGERQQLWCVAIAAKRYALFTIGDDGSPTIVSYKRHGLGYLLDPRDPADRAQETWETALWRQIVRERLGLPTEPLPWGDRPAVSQHTISSPWLRKPFATVNAGKPYAEQVKPFNFLLVAYADRSNAGTPLRLSLPFERDPSRWMRRAWTDLHSGERYHIATDPASGRGVVGVETLADVARRYPYHPEVKRNGSDGRPCGKATEGLLSHRPVREGGRLSIGKEANRIEERELVTALGDLTPIFQDTRRDPWQATVLPQLQRMAASPHGRTALRLASGLSDRALRDVLAGRSIPRRYTKVRLAALACKRMATNRVCKGCGVTLKLPEPRQIYCSSTCRERSKKRRARQRS